MKWFLSATTATCAVVVFLLAATGGVSTARSEDRLDDGYTCRSNPPWFAPIHRYYDCNPRITPDFDFASLYALPPSPPVVGRPK